MGVILKLDLPDELFRRLEKQASRLGEAPEAVALRCLDRQIGSDAEDPIEEFIGFFNSGVTDLGQNHDHYIAQRLLESLRPDEP